MNKAYYIFVMILVLVFRVHAEELETFIQDNDFKKKGKFSYVLENSYHLHDIEEEAQNLEYEYENLLSSFGLGYAISDSSVLRVSFSYAYKLKNSDKSSFATDPVLSYWKRISFAEIEGDSTGDLGLEFTPLLISKYSKQPWFGNSVGLKYRFSLKDKKNNIHATYFLGVREGRSFLENGQRRKISSSAYYGINLLYQYYLAQKFSLGAKLDFRKNSINSGTVYFSSSEVISSWSASFSLFANYTLKDKYRFTLNYMASDEGPSPNKFKRSREIDVEEKRILLSISI
jgi:hypothetical protein